ncbi:hypothetical protein [Paenibacillus sp. NPDC055715]
MEKKEKLESLNMEKFDMLIQAICDPNDCKHDCARRSGTDCNAMYTGWW